MLFVNHTTLPIASCQVQHLTTPASVQMVLTSSTRWCFSCENNLLFNFSPMFLDQHTFDSLMCMFTWHISVYGYNSIYHLYTLTNMPRQLTCLFFYFIAAHFIFETRFLTKPGDLGLRKTVWSSRPKYSLSALPSVWITSMLQILSWVLRFKFKSMCLCSRHYSDWSISLALSGISITETDCYHRSACRRTSVTYSYKLYC